jgi:alkanesulfonate monooxygenase SsuD/methylene tetrahydromethanopterin reductase-like flavin-dependent oxidoreductase (luciferase family)
MSSDTISQGRSPWGVVTGDNSSGSDVIMMVVMKM